MKLHHGINVIESDNENEKVVDFKIKESAKAFKILSSNLYSNKLKAIIREYSTNAYDAHIAAGIENTPIYVHVPTSTEPWFSVRDYGHGMDESEILSLFTTYFGSDKANSNDFIGALGLGSKSAFSYTDAFIVESYNNNTYKMYTCFLSADGVPQITKKVETETNETGVNIKIGIKKTDISDFTYTLKEVYKYFPVKPEFNIEITIPEHKVMIEHDFWKLIKNRFYDGELIAVQGNIAYPIDVDKLGNIDDKIKFLNKNSFIINFDLGELDVAASREALSYDKATIKNIKDKLHIVYSDIYNILKKEIKKHKTLWEATKKLNDMIDEYHLKGIYDHVPLLFGSIPLSKELKINLNENVEIINYKAVYGDKIKQERIKDYFNIKPSSKIKIVVCDEKSIIVAKRKAKSLVDYNNTVYFLPDEEILSSFYGVNHILTSTIDKPKNEKSKKVEYLMYKMSTNGYFNQSSGVDIKLDDEIKYSIIYYVPINRWVPTLGDGKINNSTFAKIINAAKKMNIINDPIDVFGIKTQTIKKFNLEENPYYVNVYDFIVKKMNNKIKRNKKTIKKYYMYKKIVKKFEHNQINQLVYSIVKYNDFDALPDTIKIIYNKLSEYKTYIDNYEQKSSIQIFTSNLYSLIDKKLIDLKDIEIKYFMNLQDMYPILKYVESYHIKNMIEYYEDELKKFVVDLIPYLHSIEGNINEIYKN